MSTQDFVEQAEYLEQDEFLSLFCSHPNEDEIVKKIKSKSSKLIVGPRGCGKSSLIKKAHVECQAPTSDILSLYSNFRLSLLLEPFYRSNLNAGYAFRCWLICKIYQSLIEVVPFDVAEKLKESNSHINDIDKIRTMLEMGKLPIEIEKYGNINDLHSALVYALELTEKKRIILLFDDAAHSFSQEQQKDFFDFFRELRRDNISCKAAVYPGITSFGPGFNVGHDAEKIDVWVKPSDAKYLDFMRDLALKRFSNPVELAGGELNFKFLCYASFGIPRGLFHMLSDLSKEKVTANIVHRIVGEWYEHCRTLYTDLKEKLPRYESFIQTGNDVIFSFLELIREFNTNKDYASQVTKIGLRVPLPMELEKILDYLEYSGLCYEESTISRGEKGDYKVLRLHYGALATNNSVGTAKAKNIENMLIAFAETDSRIFPKKVPEKIIDKVFSEACKISLPDCPKCRAKRENEKARFCSSCGERLEEPSIYNQLSNLSIHSLASITVAKREGILAQTNLRTIKDILLDDGTELRKVFGVGDVWLKRIRSSAEEFLS